MGKDLMKCCGVELFLQNIAHHNFIDCFKSKKFFKKKLLDGREIKKEFVLVSYCHNCKHYILKYLWYAKSSSKFWDFDEQKDIRGSKADEIFNKRLDDYFCIEIPNPYKGKRIQKQSKKIPWVYYKSISGTRQVPQYIDETQVAGRSIYSAIKII